MARLKHRLMQATFDKWTVLVLVVLGVLVGVVLTTVVQLGAHLRTPATVDAPAAPSTEVRDDYMTQAATAQQALAAAMAQIGALIAAPRLGDQLWLDEVDTSMRAVEAAYAGLVRLQPPVAWRPFHQLASAGAAECSAAMHVLVLAVDEQRPAAIEIVAALLSRCQRQLLAAQALADALEAQP